MRRLLLLLCFLATDCHGGGHHGGGAIRQTVGDYCREGAFPDADSSFR